jgi:predicted dehydrogenase
VCGAHDLTLFTKRGFALPALQGKWFNDGFRGAMGELLCAIEEGRQPSHSARENLKSLAICFAAVKSADTGRAVKPGEAVTLDLPRRH